MRKVRRVWIIVSTMVLVSGLLFSCREAPEPPSPPAPPPPGPPPAPPPAVVPEVPVQPFLRLVDSDAALYLGMRGWKDLEVFDFFQTARRLRIAERFKEIMDPGMPEFRGKEGAQIQLRELARIREKVSLRELLGGEWALAVFPGDPGRPPVPALIVRLPEGKEELYEDYFRRLASLLLPEGEEAEAGEILGLPSWFFPLPGERGSLTWFRSRGILAAAGSRDRAEALASRLLGEGEGELLSDDPLFRQSYAGLDLSGRGVLYLRVSPLTARVAELLREEYPETPPAGVTLPEREKAGYYLRGGRKVLETVDRMAGVFDFDDDNYREEVRYYLEEERGSRAVLDLLRSEPRDWAVLDYIPAAAADFSAFHLEPGKIYRPLVNFLAAGPAAGPELKKHWEQRQAAAGLRIEEDILSWLGDEFAFSTVTLGSSLFDPGGWAFFFRYTSAEDADRFLEILLAKAGEADLNVVEEEHEGAVFHVLYPPIPLFAITPSAGRVGDFLVLASRRDVFIRSADVFAGKEPSIRRNPDFLRLREKLGAEGTAVSFSRLEDQIDSLISTIRSSAAMLGMILPPPGTVDEEGEPLAPDSRQVMDLMNDITRVLEDLKVFRFLGGISLYRDGYVQTRSVIEIGR